MKFGKYVFLISGLLGILILFPLYFLESKIGGDFPPAIAHPEFYYGFIGVALACQVLFIIISLDPLKYRLMMIPAIIEKFSYSLAIIILVLQNRVSEVMLGSGLMDLTMGILFSIAFIKTPSGED
jgi:hypothetical protein